MSSFERLLARTLRQPAAPGVPCPAAETLAAYVEGALGRAERSRVEHHASECARCAAHLAALVQLADCLDASVEAPLAWWRRWPWLAPAAALAVTLGVWTSLPRERVPHLTRPVLPSSQSVPQIARQAPSLAVGVAEKKQSAGARIRVQGAPGETATAPAPMAKAAPAAPSEVPPVHRDADLRQRAETKPAAPKDEAKPAGEADRDLADQLRRGGYAAGTARERGRCAGRSAGGHCSGRVQEGTALGG